MEKKDECTFDGTLKASVIRSQDAENATSTGFQRVEWIKLSERKPEIGKEVLLSNGHIVWVGFKSKWDDNWWHSEAFSGYEWEWDVDPTHWAEIFFPLPKEE